MLGGGSGAFPFAFALAFSLAFSSAKETPELSPPLVLARLSFGAFEAFGTSQGGARV